MYKDLEKVIGYHYKDRGLLLHALSHSSHANEVHKDPLRSYERLEFLGDSILGFVTAEYLYRNFPSKPEGELTRIRAELVCEKNLAAVAEQLHLGEYLLLGHGESQGGGRHRSGILCDVMEALIAAAYLDSGFEEAKGIITRLILPKLSEISRNRDYKTELQELVQQKKDQHLSYEVLEEKGPDHQKEFLVQVLLNGRELGRGSGTSKKRAEQIAASHALDMLRKK
ncbi:MAG: ribonuclease III [Oscillospiraceae bacterium]|nr:ribonuclease III [Oscillospiraceae bacterium]